MATIKPLSVPAKRLAATISGSASSFKLDDILTWDGSTNLSSSDFGTKAYAAFRNSAGTLVEFMEIDPSTIASASITILYRGLAYNGDNLTTEISANKLTWVKGDTIVELGTHLPQLLAHYVTIIGDQTVAGIKTFSSLPATTAGNPVSDNDLARKAYVDLLATGTAITERVVVSGVAGETLVSGNLVYLKAADARWWKADADVAGTSENIILGIAQGAGTAGNAVTNGVLVRGLDNTQSGLTANTKYYVSNTAGGISTSAGTKEVFVGISHPTTATKIYFFPREEQQITENQQDFLEVAELGTDSYAASSAGNDTYAITVVPVPASYANGQRYRFKADVANTGAATLNVNSLGAISIKKLHDQDLATGDIEANQIVEVVYNSTIPSFQMQSQLATSSAPFPLVSYSLADVVIASSTAETTLLTTTIPGGTLSTGNAVRFKIFFSTLVLSDTKTLTLRLKYGATTMATRVLTYDGTGAQYNFNIGYIEGFLFANASASAQHGHIMIIASASNESFSDAGAAQFFASATGTATETSSGDLTLAVTAQFNNSSSTDALTTQFSIIERIQAA